MFPFLIQRPSEQVAAQVRSLAKVRRLSANRMILDLIENGIEPEKRKQLAIDPAVDYSAASATLIVFTLAEIADGVLLTVTESGFDQIPPDRRMKAFTANERGWGMQMKLIGAFLAQAD